ncbi:glycine-rich protein 5-like [Cucurbita pepo subsp. pepo]|uniref:glycine-rich protein 5-like n=1 Tax=Cucurbita pepo subsp. pepo TaxID=3664 RepID=UPI000C9D5829|nr:glycine-rich protein 5-like [Cucurbita pepo subsp. pepo]
MAKLLMALFLALMATHALARPTPPDATFNDQKNFLTYGGIGSYSGIGSNGLPFGGIGGAVGSGGDLGGGLGGPAGGIGGLGGLGGTGGGIGGGDGGGLGGGSGLTNP